MVKRVGRRIGALAADALLMAVSAAFALILSATSEHAAHDLTVTWPYVAASFAFALLVFPTFGLDRTFWRYSGAGDHRQLLIAALLCPVLAFGCLQLMKVSAHFEIALVALHTVIGTALLVGIRTLYRNLRGWRLWRRIRLRSKQAAVSDHTRANIIVVGFGAVAEALLRSIDEHRATHIRVIGLLDHKNRHVGRIVGRYSVLGRPEDAKAIVEDLRVRGVRVDRVVVTCTFRSLSLDAQVALKNLAKEAGIELQMLAERLGLDLPEARESSMILPRREALRFTLEQERIPGATKLWFWCSKRTVDVGLSVVLLVLLAPALAFAALTIMVTMGRPVVFWQERPGLAGVPFRLFKLRTMQSALDRTGRRLADRERVTRIGSFLRRMRIDELPQLINILRGDMSFIGPRPLLSQDQDLSDAARLLVRPGLTGWAQVTGGRNISRTDKSALDVWYVKNACWLLDLKIAVCTIPIILFGDKVNKRSIQRAWKELKETGIANEFAENPHLKSGA